jgi:hypothetical protein
VEFGLPFNQRPGEYDLFIAVGTRLGTPTIRLPLAEGDGQLAYRLGKLSITGHYGATVGELRPRDGKWLLPVTWTLHDPPPPGVTPFCHCERDGQIAFFGQPDAADAAAQLAPGGTVELGFVIDPPLDARGQTFDVRFGLWVPERIGRPDERLIPDTGVLDKRVRAGTLNVSGTGEVTLAP